MGTMNLGSNQRISGRSYLDGQCLIAMPGMSDQRFVRSVVYLCAHSEDGAMGIIVNKPAADTRFPELLVQLDVIPSDQAIRLPSQAERMKVLRGGPVETKRGFVLHSADFFLESATLPIDDGICLTATLDILRAIAVGTGPENAVLALGYAGWGAGQLESEIQSNGWLHCAADEALLFDDALDTKYARALGKLGIDQAFLSKDAGHA
ncbi:YqgE/AlgH family protein [Bosea sp. (in: a-proteobacteria)]|jgi:putative transcriptional regulator|uniref:YqgE/AlgH family protein n=1 Tax=Bosea sp. (in: a-proteobacteria) TaxID=1871050 RepID=UPI002DDD6E5C|nr:YqgE/AlgH family protein [Bosea sp. (in: a-proteobacteria)]HEV2509263.1 YqgE/AlgH family protein [Bosea sp. (in: a-proteobacteria)]